MRGRWRNARCSASGNRLSGLRDLYVVPDKNHPRSEGEYVVRAQEQKRGNKKCSRDSKKNNRHGLLFVIQKDDGRRETGRHHRSSSKGNEEFAVFIVHNGGFQYEFQFPAAKCHDISRCE